MFFVAMIWLGFFVIHRDELRALTLVGVIAMFAFFAGVFAAGWSRGSISARREPVLITWARYRDLKVLPRLLLREQR
jgi:hypothetical protein